MSDRIIKIDQSGASIGIGYSHKTTAEKIGGVFNNSDSESNQELKSAVNKIQQIIADLKSNNPVNTISTLALIATQTIEKIEGDSNEQRKLVNTVKKFGLAAFENYLEKVTDRIIVSFLASAFKSWIAKTD